jgi:hypothetical protein
MLAQDVLDSVRLHWRDDQAAEVALDAYRGARQGSLRVRDFGSRIEVLANAASVADPTPVFSEVDRMSTFLRGLSPAYRDFFIMQVATLVLVGRKPTTSSSWFALRLWRTVWRLSLKPVKPRATSVSRLRLRAERRGRACPLASSRVKPPSSADEKTQ